MPVLSAAVRLFSLQKKCVSLPFGGPVPLVRSRNLFGGTFKAPDPPLGMTINKHFLRASLAAAVGRFRFAGANENPR